MEQDINGNITKISPGAIAIYTKVGHAYVKGETELLLFYGPNYFCSAAAKYCYNCFYKAPSASLVICIACKSTYHPTCSFTCSCSSQMSSPIKCPSSPLAKDHSRSPYIIPSPRGPSPPPPASNVHLASSSSLPIDCPSTVVKSEIVYIPSPPPSPPPSSSNDVYIVPSPPVSMSTPIPPAPPPSRKRRCLFADPPPILPLPSNMLQVYIVVEDEFKFNNISQKLLGHEIFVSYITKNLIKHNKLTLDLLAYLALVLRTRYATTFISKSSYINMSSAIVSDLLVFLSNSNEHMQVTDQHTTKCITVTATATETAEETVRSICKSISSALPLPFPSFHSNIFFLNRPPIAISINYAMTTQKNMTTQQQNAFYFENGYLYIEDGMPTIDAPVLEQLVKAVDWSKVG